MEKLDSMMYCSLMEGALAYSDRAEFVMEWSHPLVWDGPEDVIPPERIPMLEAMWDAAHLTIGDIRAKTGLNSFAFASRYCIFVRTLDEWESGKKECPLSLKLLLAEDVGLYKKPEIA